MFAETLSRLSLSQYTFALTLCCKLQVKKLVYVYLTRYAEEQQDVALLSIATFQRSMKVKGCSLMNCEDNSNVILSLV